MMELKDFITTTISDIASAVSEADEELKAIGGLMNPGKDGHDLVGGATFEAPRTTLNFDIAIAATKAGKGQAGVKAKLYVVEAAIGGGGEMSSSSSSRLTFSLDVVLPHDRNQAARISRRTK